MNTSNSLLNRKSIAILLLLFAVVALTVYFVLWRPTDKDYDNTLNQLTELQKSKETIDSISQEIQYSEQINKDTVDALEKTVTAYGETVTAIAGSKVVERDMTINKHYSKTEGEFRQYGDSAKQLVASIKAYRQIVTTCSSLVEKVSTLGTAKDFDAAAKDCKKSLTNGRSSSDRTFSPQFLNEYIVHAEALLDAYRQNVVEAENNSQSIAFSTVTAIKEKIAILSEKELNLTFKPNLTNSFESLTSVIKTQKNQLIR